MPSLMGIRSTSAMTPLGDRPTIASHHNSKLSNAVSEVEMGHGNGKWDSDESDFHDRPGYSVAVMGKSRYNGNNSEERLTNADAQSRRGGIYKGTSVSVSYA
jgi:hypothetical protein